MLYTTTHLHEIFDDILLRDITELDVNNSNCDEQVETWNDVSWYENVEKLCWSDLKNILTIYEVSYVFIEPS